MKDLKECCCFFSLYIILYFHPSNSSWWQDLPSGRGFPRHLGLPLRQSNPADGEKKMKKMRTLVSHSVCYMRREFTLKWSGIWFNLTRVLEVIRKQTGDLRFQRGLRGKRSKDLLSRFKSFTEVHNKYHHPFKRYSASWRDVINATRWPHHVTPHQKS